MTAYQSLRITQQDKIACVEINRPDKLNAMDAAFWTEMISAFEWVDATDEIRVVVVTGAGKHFSAGIDLALLAQAAGRMSKDIGRNAEVIRGNILRLQASFNAVDRCRKPVIAAIQGYCLGGAIDLILSLIHI